MNSQRSRKNLLFIALSILSIFGYGFFVFAAPPGSGGYNPGETLDPECTPGQLVPEPCIVQLTSGGSSGWSLSGNTVTGGVAASIDTVFNGVGLNDITMTGPYTGTTTQTWVIVITATGTPDQMEVIIDGDSEYVGDVFPPGPLPVDDGLTLNFGSDTGHTVGDSWEFTMTPTSGGTTAFLGTLNNEDLVFKTNNTEWIRLSAAGNLNLSSYTNSRDNSGVTSPTNFLYTDGSGNLLSAPTSLLGGGSFSLTLQDEGSTLTTSTNTINFTGAGVNATNSGGGVVTVDISGGGGGADGNIYDNDGTLAGSRTLDANNNNLSFTNLGIFSALTQNGNTYLGLFDNVTGVGYGGYVLSTRQLIGGIEHVTNFGSDISGFGLDWEDLNAGIIDTNGTTSNGAAIEVQADNGLRFRFSNAGVFDEYTFPRTDGIANQVLTTDGLGQLSWQSGGGSDGNIYDNNGTLAGNRILNADGNNLTFSNLDQLTLSTQSGNTGMIMRDKGSGYGVVLLQGQKLISGDDHRSQISTDIGDGNYDADFDDLHLGLADISTIADNGAAIEVNATTGIRFRFRNAGVLDEYFFPRIDGATDQVLTTNGSGVLSWETPFNILWYDENNTAPALAPSATGTGSIAMGDGAKALSSEMFVYGTNAGTGSTNTFASIFIGNYTGASATNAMLSIFLGNHAGENAVGAEHSNFFGDYAGQGASGSNNSNFIGGGAGLLALNSEYSNFIGDYAGAEAENATSSIFLGTSAGYRTLSASNSIFIGNGSGSYDTVDNTLSPNDNSILIGYSTNTGGFSNSIALGGFAANTASNQFMIGSAARPVDTTVWKGSAGTECTLTTGTGVSCTSDERLKTNIVDLTSDTLDKLLNVKTVTYNWIQNPDSPTQIGFLAQDLEQYFPELVATNNEDKKSVYYSQITPILVEAIREMNLKITDIGNMETPNTWRDGLIAWFGNTANGITDLFTKRIHTDELCVGTVCVTQDQFLQMVNNSGTVISGNNNPIVIPDPTTPSDDTESSDVDTGANPDDSSGSSSDTGTLPTE